MKNVILSRIFLGGIAPSFFDQHIHTTGNIRGGGAPRVALPGASADLCPAVATRSLGEAQIAHQAGARAVWRGLDGLRWKLMLDSMDLEPSAVKSSHGFLVASANPGWIWLDHIC
jgi:hypothetical protein